MGYSTYFYGAWTLTPSLSLAQTDYLQKFSRTRRVKRDPNAIKNERRLAGINLDLGVDAEYFVDTEDEDESILDNNQPPGSQPSLRCQWRVNDRGDLLAHNGAEKFSEYVEWLDYLVRNFFLPWGIRVDGLVKYVGDELTDNGVIEIRNNIIEVRPNIYARICPKEVIHIKYSELVIEDMEVYYEITDASGHGESETDQIDRQNVFQVVRHSKAGMLICSVSWGVIWLPDNLVDRFSIVPDKLAVRCPIAIEPLPKVESSADGEPDCDSQVVKSEDGDSRENFYSTNSLWQIDRLHTDDLIVALDPSGRHIVIDRSGLDCFVGIKILLEWQ
jgi:hypothetical protein